MTTVFIAGSISISRLHENVQARIGNIVSSGLDVVVGDADGADASIQHFLAFHNAKNVTVYCTGDTPRNNIGGWNVHTVQSFARPGTRAYFTAKDIEMARRSDYGLMIWDCKSTGTLSNVLELLGARKKSVVFVNKKSAFVNVTDRAGLEHLLTFMSAPAKAKAEDKLGLSSKLARMGQDQLAFHDSAHHEVPNASSDAAVAAYRQAETIPTRAPTAAARRDTGRSSEGSDEGANAGQHSGSRGVEPEGQSMRLRWTLIAALKEHILRRQLSPSQAAKAFGVTQPRILDLSRENVDLLGLDTLVNMAAAAGLRVEMHVGQADAGTARRVAAHTSRD